MKFKALTVFAVLILTSCSSADIEKAVRDGAESAKVFAVRTTAESLGQELQREAVERGLPVSDPVLIGEVLKRFPGVTITAIRDGKTTVTLLEAQACLTLPTSGLKSSAVAGPCA
jgi:hypothetical protein